MWRLFSRAVLTAFVGGAFVMAAPSAEGGYTAVKQSKRRNEVSHERILEHVYGGNFAADSTGLSFSNESGVTVTRVDDAADESWAGRRVSARAVAAFSRGRKTAGYFGASSRGSVEKMLDASGRKFDVGGTGETDSPLEGGLVFGKNGRRGRTFSSVASANADGMDHLVSYEVKGLSGQQASVFLLCWEDKFSRRSDRDFNDLVVEMQAGEAATRSALAEPLLIPLPPAAWTGLAGLLSLGVASVVRRRPSARRRVVAA